MPSAVLRSNVKRLKEQHMPQRKAGANKTNRKPRKQKQRAVRVTNVPAAVSVSVTNTKPSIKSSRNGVLIKHREFFTSARFNSTGGTSLADPNWQLFQFIIQPADPQTFPWLSTIAPSYEQYRFKSLRFKYVPSVGTNYTGTINMAVDYDVRDAAPLASSTYSVRGWIDNSTTRRDLMSNKTATMQPVWQTNQLVADPVSLLGGLRSKYTRKFQYDPTAASAARSSDCGLFLLGLYYQYTAPISGVEFGDLWVEYEVELMIPQANVAGYSGQVIHGGDTDSDVSFPPEQAFPPSSSDAFAQGEAVVSGPVLTNWSTKSEPTGELEERRYNTTFTFDALKPNAYYRLDFDIDNSTSGTTGIVSPTIPTDKLSGLQLVLNTMLNNTADALAHVQKVTRIVRAVQSTGSFVVSFASQVANLIDLASVTLTPLTAHKESVVPYAL